jgi:hypothetical protein
MSCSYTVTISPARASGIICPKEIPIRIEKKRYGRTEQPYENSPKTFDLTRKDPLIIMKIF